MKKIIVFITAFLMFLLFFDVFLIPSGLQKSYLGKAVYCDSLEYYNVSGVVTYKESSQPVNSGFVKALVYDWSKDAILTTDSAAIGIDGHYTLPKCHTDTTFIMAYGDDELLDFTPGYHDTTISWQSSIIILPKSNIGNININVNRIIANENGEHHVSGRILKEPNSPNEPIKDAVIYAKIGSKYKGFGVSDTHGYYHIDSLPSGNFEIIAERMGYYSDYRIIQIGQYNTDTVNFYLDRVASIGPPHKIIPKEFTLYNNYPNPFNPTTRIKFDIPSSVGGQLVRLVIYDAIGREVATLINQQLRPGVYEIAWDAAGYPSGVYFYKLMTDEFTQTKKMVLLK